MNLNKVSYALKTYFIIPSFGWIFFYYILKDILSKSEPQDVGYGLLIFAALVKITILFFVILIIGSYIYYLKQKLQSGWKGYLGFLFRNTSVYVLGILFLFFFFLEKV